MSMVGTSRHHTPGLVRARLGFGLKVRTYDTLLVITSSHAALYVLEILELYILPSYI